MCNYLKINALIFMNKDFGERFTLLMDSRGVDAKKLELAGVGSKQSISKWKKGTVPETEAMTKICEYFKVSSKWLLTGNDSKYQNKVEPNYQPQPEIRTTQESLDLIRHLSEENKTLKAKVDELMGVIVKVALGENQSASPKTNKQQKNENL